MYIYIYILPSGFNSDIHSGNQTWQLKVLCKWCSSWENHRTKRWIFHCRVSLFEGNHQQ